MTTPSHTGRALIVSITDHLLHGEDDGGAGALVTELLIEAGFVVDGTVVVPSDEVAIRTALRRLHDEATDLAVTCERAILSRAEAGCSCCRRATAGGRAARCGATTRSGACCRRSTATSRGGGRARVRRGATAGVTSSGAPAGVPGLLGTRGLRLLRCVTAAGLTAA